MVEMASYIRAASLGGFEDLVRSFGINPMDVMREVGILPALLRDPDSFINYEHYLDLLEVAAKHCDAPCFGLNLAAKQNIQTIGLIGVYMSRQDTVLQALNVAQKYVYLHADGIMFQVTQLDDQLCELNFIRLNENDTILPQKAQLSIGLIFNIFKDLIGPTWQAKQIKLKQKQPDVTTTQIFRNTFNCQVEFEADRDALYFPAKLLKARPYHFQEELVDRLIVQQLETQRLKKQDTEVQLIESTIKMLLATGDCSIENTALCMGIHPKKLQRILKDQGTSYRNVLEAVRKAETLRIMNHHQDIHLTDLALQLGYAELSIFSRKFKSWFGMTPSEWRIAHFS
ncbi:Helix-turn-helix domain-containing protein [Acinetobacter marinus]|uniref:Helix-turn-helix domain-containing protein n=1 Tax=Acinetobacter marinus TaxID=281375 RepID=A0A1G6GMI8_9GAMM|nr:AraC family transcriptional regulator [Acinetobacter marinus]SDB83211.1 Helix-turn-helix domain-containing protein [Acinetobacter marinus]